MWHRIPNITIWNVEKGTPRLPRDCLTVPVGEIPLVVGEVVGLDEVDEVVGLERGAFLDSRNMSKLDAEKVVF
jgi:hypothetical protein